MHPPKPASARRRLRALGLVGVVALLVGSCRSTTPAAPGRGLAGVDEIAADLRQELATPLDPSGPTSLEVPAFTGRLEAACDECPAVVVEGVEVRLPEPDAAWARAYAEALLHRAIPVLSARYGGMAPPRVRLELVATREAFHARLRGRLSGESEGAYGGGVGLVLAPSASAERWGETLVHELAHAYQDAASAGRAPRWLAEGLAEADARAVDPAFGRVESVVPPTLSALGPRARLEAIEAALRGAPSPLDPGEARTCLGAIATRLAAIDPGGPMRLLAALAQGLGIDDAATAAYGRSLDALLDAVEAGLVRASAAEVDTACRLDAGPGAEACRRACAQGAASPCWGLAWSAVDRSAVDLGVALEALVAVEPARYGVQCARARYAWLEGDLETAGAHARAARALRPTGRTALDLALRVADAAGHAAERDALVDALVDVDPAASSLLEGAIRSASTRGDLRRAAILGERYALFAPRHADVFDTLARAQRALGDGAAHDRAAAAAVWFGRATGGPP